MAGTSSGIVEVHQGEGPVRAAPPARRPGPGGTGPGARRAPAGVDHQPGVGAPTRTAGGGPARGTKTWVSTPHSRQAASSRSNTRGSPQGWAVVTTAIPGRAVMAGLASAPGRAGSARAELTNMNRGRLSFRSPLTMALIR